ncbi:hypothetical protein ACFWSJ_36900 [Streptomyces niveus]
MGITIAVAGRDSSPDPDPTPTACNIFDPECLGGNGGAAGTGA